LTVDWTSVERAEHGQALACSPEVAKWLHDEVVQRLSSVVAALGSEGALRRADQVRGRAELEVALGALRLLLNCRIEKPRARRFRTVVEAVRAASVPPDGRHVQLDLAGDAEVSSSTGELVADFVAEAMRNAVKHARACTIALTVTVDEDVVRIHAFNDGVVARPAHGIGAGIGLRLLAARALDHHAYVLSKATPPGGWSTTLALERDALAPGAPR
jgi:nitrate/nitrite-specific signal transduction histidine kinase